MSKYVYTHTATPVQAYGNTCTGIRQRLCRHTATPVQAYGNARAGKQTNIKKNGQRSLPGRHKIYKKT